MTEALWAALAQLMHEFPLVRRLKPPWVDDEFIRTRAPQPDSPLLAQWRQALRDITRLEAFTICDADGRPVLHIEVNGTARPISSLTARTLRTRLSHIQRPPVAPIKPHWRGILRIDYIRGNVADQWRWVHDPQRTASQRLQHLLVIHGSLPVLARMIHTDPLIRSDLCYGCGRTRETVEHYFASCAATRPTRLLLASIVNHLGRLSTPVTETDASALLLTGLVPYRSKVTLPHSWTAINIAQAVALHTMWLARMDVHLGDAHAPINGERARVLFVLQLRCQLRRLGQHLPQLMGSWTQAPALFKDNRRLLFFE